MHHQDGAHSLAYRLDDELLQREFRVGLNHPVEINVILDREFATSEPGQQSGIETDTRAFDIFVGLGEIEIADARDQVRQRREDLRLLADHRAMDFGDHRHPMAGGRGTQWTHAGIGFAQDGVLVNNLGYRWRRWRRWLRWLRDWFSQGCFDNGQLLDGKRLLAVLDGFVGQHLFEIFKR